jgi:hypothetical protein
MLDDGILKKKYEKKICFSLRFSILMCFVCLKTKDKNEKTKQATKTK